MNKAILLFTVVILSVSAFAQNQGLDPAFAKGGILIDTTYNRGGIVDIGVQSDGKIITFGGSYILRYLTDGTYDSSFGKNGIQRLDTFSKPKTLYASACVLQPDGKILLTGTTLAGVNTWGGFLMRINANGSIDSAFGNNGVQFTTDETQKLYLKPDGGILTAGEYPNYQIAINAFKVNGAVDSSFGSNGRFQRQITPYNPQFATISVLADGKIALIGGDYNSNIYYLRLLPSGEADSTFCSAGICYATAGMAYCRDAIINSDGKALVTVGGLDSCYLVRLKADATLDSSFGTNSGGYLAVPDLRINRIARLPDGRILCAGMSNEHFALARVLNDGKGIDTAFGNKGNIATNVSGGHYERIYALALQADGKIVAAGISKVPDLDPRYWNPAGAIVRYLPDAQVGILEAPLSGKLGLIIYPNPASTSLHANLPAPGLLQLYSIEGMMLRQVYCAQKEQVLDVASLQQGIYLLRLKTGDRSYSRLFVKE